jgi:hypothetical protein
MGRRREPEQDRMHFVVEFHSWCVGAGLTAMVHWGAANFFIARGQTVVTSVRSAGGEGRA